jgi:hypothetical protein
MWRICVIRTHHGLYLCHLPLSTILFLKNKFNCQILPQYVSGCIGHILLDVGYMSDTDTLTILEYRDFIGTMPLNVMKFYLSSFSYFFQPCLFFLISFMLTASLFFLSLNAEKTTTRILERPIHCKCMYYVQAKLFKDAFN